jgi:hypothetical protein
MSLEPDAVADLGGLWPRCDSGQQTTSAWGQPGNPRPPSGNHADAGEPDLNEETTHTEEAPLVHHRIADASLKLWSRCLPWTDVTINARDPSALAELWAGSVGGTPRDSGNDFLLGPGEGRTPLLFQNPDQPNQQPVGFTLVAAPRTARPPWTRPYDCTVATSRTDPTVTPHG